MFNISVVIPVYNAAEFVTRAVESALAQPETAEILLIEDGSPDDSLAVCQSLANKYEKVKLLRHPGGQNKGAGASRNMGMKNASFEYIAFLDADDYYLPGRFKVAEHIFESDPSCEGIYEAIGMEVKDDDSWNRWQKANKPEERLKTIKGIVDPSELGRDLITGKKGYFSLDGFIIRKNILYKSGYMEETLRLHQDTEFIIRTAIVSKLLPGSLDKPVSMWRVHEQNRISAPRTTIETLNDRLLMWTNLYEWCKKKSYRKYQEDIMPIIVSNIISKKRFNNEITGKILRRIARLKQVCVALIKEPKLMIDQYFWSALFTIIHG